MKKSISILTLFVFAIFLSGCGTSETELNGLINDETNTILDNMDIEVNEEIENNNSELTLEEVHELLRYKLVEEISIVDDSENGKLNLIVTYDSSAEFSEISSHMKDLLKKYDNFGSGGYGAFMNMSAETDNYEFGLSLTDYSTVGMPNGINTSVIYQIEEK